jgi:predicted dehydrogenase
MARLAVIGLGDIGRRHVQAIGAVEGAELAAIVEPGPGAANAPAGVPLFADVEAMLAAMTPDGCIVATPNVTHLPLALRLIAAGIPLLVEKPIADTIANGYALADAAEAAGVPVLVGHHRRHNPLVQEARRAVREGMIGRLTAVQATFLVRKPDAYYDVAWRRQAGGGPILINLIHDIDNLRFIAGEIVAVQGVVSNARRGNEVEDTAAAILTFANGAIGTALLSDTTPSPWSWELTAGERTSYTFPRMAADCYYLAGTEGSLAVPSLRLWRPDGAPSWQTPMREERLTVEEAAPAERQIRHFAEVIAGRASPIITARDAARTLEVTLAVAEAARRGSAVRLDKGE